MLESDCTQSRSDCLFRPIGAKLTPILLVRSGRLLARLPGEGDELRGAGPVACGARRRGDGAWSERETKRKTTIDMGLSCFEGGWFERENERDTTIDMGLSFFEGGGHHHRYGSIFF